MPPARRPWIPPCGAGPWWCSPTTTAASSPAAPRPGRIVVAVLEGAFTLKRLSRHQGRLRLEAAHPAYPPLELGDAEDTLLWGVATHAIHPL